MLNKYRGMFNLLSNSLNKKLLKYFVLYYPIDYQFIKINDLHLFPYQIAKIGASFKNVLLHF